MTFNTTNAIAWRSIEPDQHAVLLMSIDLFRKHSNTLLKKYDQFLQSQEEHHSEPTPISVINSIR